MKTENFIPLDQLCTHYKVEMSFFSNLKDLGLIEIITVEKSHCIEVEKLKEVEKIIRLYNDLELNFEGIDTVFNLLEKIDQLQSELISTKNRLRLYED